MAGTGDETGLAGNVIPEFKSQGEVPLQHQVGAAAVIPCKLPTVVRTDQMGTDRRGGRGSTEAIGSQANSSKRL